MDPKTYPQVLGRNIDRLKLALVDGTSPASGYPGPATLADSPDLSELESILTALEHLPDRNEQAAEAVRERQREKEVIKKRLGQLTAQCPAVAEFVAANLAELNGSRR